MSEKLINDDGITSLVNRIAAKVANKYATKAIATQSANGLMSAADKAKLEKAKKDAQAKHEANKAALEKAKKDAQAKQDARKKAIENEKTYWKNLLK